MPATVTWAERNGLRWAFTLSNAGSRIFEDRADLNCLGEINWDAVKAINWGGNGVSSDFKEGKQAEFLVEHRFPWSLVKAIGVHSDSVGREVISMMAGHDHRPAVKVKSAWFY